MHICAVTAVGRFLVLIVIDGVKNTKGANVFKVVTVSLLESLVQFELRYHIRIIICHIKFYLVLVLLFVTCLQSCSLVE